MGFFAALVRFAAEQPGFAVGLFIALHVLLWTAVPVLVHEGPPLDTVEAYAIGRAWVIGTYKHPALPSWLLELTRLATGSIGWPAYLLSSLSIGATYAFVFLLGRDALGARLGLAGTLPLAGVMFFSWITPELNHTIVQMPIWAGIVWCLWRARAAGGAGIRASGWWMALGALGGLGLYAKFSVAVLLLVAAAFIVADGRCRQSLRQPGPWLGFAAFIVVAAPLANWLWVTNFHILEYGATRASSQKAGSVLSFLLKQSSSGLGLALILAYAAGWFTPSSRQPATGPAPVEKSIADGGDLRAARRFIFVFNVAPLALCIIAALVMHVGLRGAWGAAMLSFIGLGLVASPWLTPRIDDRFVGRVAAVSLALLVAIPIAYGLYTANWPRWSKAVPKVAWPQKAIADGLEAVWRQHTGRPLRIVASDTWVGGIVALHGVSQPRLLIDGDFARSPWISQAELQREGALVVWAYRSQTPPGDLQRLIGQRIDGAILVEPRSAKPKHKFSIYYTFIEPAPAAPPETGTPPPRQ